MFDPIQTSPTMWWTSPAMNFAVPPGVIIPERVCPQGQWPTDTGCRKLPGTSVPEWFLGVGAVDPASIVDGASLGGALVGMGLRGVLGYFVGKWTGASKGWTAAGAAIFGVPGTAASIYFTKKDRVKSNRKRRAKRRVCKNPLSSCDRSAEGRVLNVRWGIESGSKYAGKTRGGKRLEVGPLSGKKVLDHTHPELGVRKIPKAYYVKMGAKKRTRVPDPFVAASTFVALASPSSIKRV